MPRPSSASLTAAVRGIAPVPSSSTGRRAPATASARIARPARAAMSSAARSVWASTPFCAAAGPAYPPRRRPCCAMTGPGGAASAVATAVHGRRRPAPRRRRRLGYRPPQRPLVDPLVADPARRAHRVRDHHHRQPVQRRVRDTVDRAGQPRSPGDHHRPGRSGEVRAGSGHDRRGRLAVRQDEAQPRRLRRPDHVQVRDHRPARRTSAGSPPGPAPPRSPRRPAAERQCWLPRRLLC